jgi:hypothetical protein
MECRKVGAVTWIALMCVLLDASAALADGAGLIGDLVGTGKPEVGSAIKVMRVVAGIDAAPPTGDLWQWDCNKSGAVDVGDAVKILRCVVGLDPWPMGDGWVPIHGTAVDYATLQPLANAVASWSTYTSQPTGADGKFTLYAQNPTFYITVAIAAGGRRSASALVSTSPSGGDAGTVLVYPVEPIATVTDPQDGAAITGPGTLLFTGGSMRSLHTLGHLGPDIQTVQVSLNGGAWLTATSSDIYWNSWQLGTGPLAAGPNTFRARAYDGVEWGPETVRHFTYTP